MAKTSAAITGRGEENAATNSFLPIADANAATLILGSMPGQASLAAGRYYSHPRNAFWPIMGRLFGAVPGLEYKRRVEILLSAGVAVWDVLATCNRPGSLDSAIRREGLVANDIAGFLAQHPRVTRVFLNGAKAAELFESQVIPELFDVCVQRYRLPSTSPARAGLTFEQKLASWLVVASQD